MYKAILLSAAFLLISCKQESVTKDSTEITVSENTEANKNWQDSVLKRYILKSRNELVRSNADSEQWLFDQTTVTDTATYFIYQVGHDVADEGGQNPRFVTDQWVYIDSLTHNLYEYDLPNDQLQKWMP